MQEEEGVKGESGKRWTVVGLVVWIGGVPNEEMTRETGSRLAMGDGRWAWGMPLFLEGQNDGVFGDSKK